MAGCFSFSFSICFPWQSQNSTELICHHLSLVSENGKLVKYKTNKTNSNFVSLSNDR